MLDFATAGYAEGKVRVAARDGKQLPPGVLQTKDGDPTTDPQDFYLGGALLPFGGHKGYGLSVMIQILGDALCGTGPQKGRELMSNHLLLIAVSPGRLQSIPVFHEVVGQVQQRIRSTAPDGSPEAVLLPGDVEARTVRIAASGSGGGLRRCLVRTRQARPGRPRCQVRPYVIAVADGAFADREGLQADFAGLARLRWVDLGRPETIPTLTEDADAVVVTLQRLTRGGHLGLRANRAGDRQGRGRAGHDRSRGRRIRRRGR